MPLLSAALVSLALILPIKTVLAQDIAPVDINEDRPAAFDLSQGHLDFSLWDKRLIASGENNVAAKKDWSNGTFLCYSDSNPSVGACPTKDIRDGSQGSTEIRLMFVERRSKAGHVVSFRASKHTVGNTNDHKRINDDYGSGDGVVVQDALRLEAKIPAAEFKRFPSGGIWDAHWKLRLHRRDRGFVSEVNLKIKLTITYTKNVQIFLPEHNTTTPTVDLGLTGQVSRDGRTTGRRNIDMCLYDGFGSNSSYFEVTVMDGLSVPQRGPSSFSVVRDGTSGQSLGERIDYGVTYLHNGQRKSLNNGETIRLLGGNNTDVRPVYLPNIPVPVLCKPMPLTLETPEFNAKEKSAGSYTGKLKIIFSPSAQSL
ncbi:Colonization factor antigen I subunit E [Pandoraea pulmonicola]|uniref:Colonization factor antigen I subunit E n=2 Tax=Pandoraea pulmonicola TaxID=93221 RepID=A0AAJ4ZH74_PANPU|nr:Colonization factor antigen I subunit E [Pandoraea pulmonicola]